MLTDHFLQAWEHSGELFKLLMRITDDQRIPVEIRLEILADLAQVIDKAKAKA